MSVLIALALAWLVLRWSRNVTSPRTRFSPARELYERRLRDAGRG